MDNYHAELLVESNKRLMIAMGMHWANEAAMIEKTGPLPYNEGHFHNLACEPF